MFLFYMSGIIVTRHLGDGQVRAANIDISSITLKHVEVSTTQTITSTETNISSMSGIIADIPVGISRVRITAVFPSVVATSVGARLLVKMYQDDEEFQRFYFVPPVLGIPLVAIGYADVSSPGNHTYKLTANRENGSGNFTLYADDTTIKTLTLELA